jgi:hypothetical protein
MGRPRTQPEYSEFLANKILARLEDGETLMAICKDADMPSRQTVGDWERLNEDFSSRCRRARERGIDARVDKIDDIVKDVLEGRVDPNAAKVAISHAQWIASKLAPKMYGERITAEVNANISLIDLVNQAMAKRREARLIEAQPLELSVGNDPLAGDKDKGDQ